MSADVAVTDARDRLGLAGGLLLLATVTLLWGVNWPVMKVAVSEIPIWIFRAICLGGAAVGLALVCRMAGQSLRIPRGQLKPLLLVSVFNVTIWHVCSAAGLAHLQASRAAIIAFTMPLWAAFLAVPLLGERLTWNALVGLLLGLSGMAVLILPDYAALTAAPLGPLYMLIAAISWATGTVFLKRARFTLPTAALTTWQLAFGGIPVILGAVAFDRDFAPTAVSLQAWLATAFALVAATIFCHWAWFRLVRRFPAVGISVGTLAIPVIGVLASAIGLGEPVGVEVVAALVLVVLALFFVLILPGLRAR